MVKTEVNSNAIIEGDEVVITTVRIDRFKTKSEKEGEKSEFELKKAITDAEINKLKKQIEGLGVFTKDREEILKEVCRQRKITGVTKAEFDKFQAMIEAINIIKMQKETYPKERAEKEIELAKENLVEWEKDKKMLIGVK